MSGIDGVLSDLKRGGESMDNTELLKKIAADLDVMKEQMASMQEQLTRIEQGQKLLAGDVFDHKVRLLGIEGKKAK